MAELTYLWDGTVTGDASAAPYDHAEFNPYFFAPHFSQSNDVYVAPREGGDLRVASGGATSSTIIVRTGQALLRGFLYTLDEDLSFNVLRPTINPRWDRTWLGFLFPLAILIYGKAIYIIRLISCPRIVLLPYMIVLI